MGMNNRCHNAGHTTMGMLFTDSMTDDVDVPSTQEGQGDGSNMEGSRACWIGTRRDRIECALRGSGEVPCCECYDDRTAHLRMELRKDLAHINGRPAGGGENMEGDQIVLFHEFSA